MERLMPHKHHVYLIPGFFGFANLGDLKYFAHVTEVLSNSFLRLGIDAQVHNVATSPTAGVLSRAERLLDAIHATAADDDDPIHLIGHSSGGLDARLLVAAGASLGSGVSAERYAARVRSVVTVATPHRGTPIVSMFISLFGARVLKLLSLGMIHTLRYGRLPLGVLVKMGGVLVRLDNASGQDALDQLYVELLHDFSEERQKAIRDFFTEVEKDQGLLTQLLPEGMVVFNALTRDQADVRYGCVLTRGRRPGVSSTISAGLGGYAQASHALYAALYQLAARTPLNRAPSPRPQQIQAMLETWGDIPSIRANDGIVPTLSQLHGDVICAVSADHHDVIGHFDDPSCHPPHFDWITSGSGFKRADFEHLWSSVANWIHAGVASQKVDKASDRQRVAS